jgi:hypothetical protein
MNKADPSRFLTFILPVFLNMLVPAPAAAFRLPGADSEAGTSYTRILIEQVDGLRTVLIILLVLVILSVTSNILISLAMFRTQEALRQALNTVQQVDILKDTARQLVRAPTATIGSLPGTAAGENKDFEDIRPEDIEILKTGL